MWGKEPTHMTEKVTISRGFRLCFRDVLRGMPFTVEEEQSREEPIDVTPLVEPKALEAQKETPKPSETEAIILARSELQQVFKKLVLSGLFEKAELEAMKEAATEKKGDLEALRSLLTAWQIKAAEREEKGGAA
jgi:hypothetical protein